MKTRFVIVIDYDTETGECEAESMSPHRSGKVERFVETRGPAGALRTIADAMDAAENRWLSIPD